MAHLKKDTTIGGRVVLGEIDEYREQLIQTDRIRQNESLINRKKVKRGMITIIDDDGEKGFYTKLRPLALEYGITFTSALITGVSRGFPDDSRTPNSKFMNYEEIMQMHQEGSAEFISHTHTHTDLRTLTVEQIRDEFIKSQDFLRKYGFNHRSVVFPFNRVNQNVMNEVRTIFDYSFGNAPHGLVVPPFDNYYIPRNVIRFGENLLALKNLIDLASANNEWVVIYTHVDQDGYIESEMREIIEYALSKNLEFVTSLEGIETHGNIAQLEIPKYTNFDPDNIDEIDIITARGDILSDRLGRTVIKINHNVTNDTPLNDFSEKAVTYSQIRATNRLGFPNNLPGILITHNIRRNSEETYWGWQEYRPHKMQVKYIRRWDSDTNRWTGWTLQNNYIIDTSYTVRNDTPIMDFTAGAITESLIRKADATGFPNDAAGVLITHRPHNTAVNWCFQEFKPIYSDDKYIRHWSSNDASGNWSPWRKFVAEDINKQSGFRGALINLNASQSIPNKTYTKIAFDNVVYDTDGFFSSNQPTRLTVPSGISKIKISANIEWGISADGYREVKIRKNDVTENHGLPEDRRQAMNRSNVNLSSSVIQVTQGDYFEILVYQDSGGALDIHGNYPTWFSIEVIE